jgi:hypothetical protein
MRTSTKKWLKKYLDDLPGYKSPDEDLNKTKKKVADKNKMVKVLGEMMKFLFIANGEIGKGDLGGLNGARRSLLKFLKCLNGVFLEGCKEIKKW